MSNKRGQAGRIGISGNASVEMEILEGENAGDPAPLPADPEDNLLLAKMVGEDGDGNFQRISTDKEGRIDLASTPDVNIGDVNLLDDTDSIVNPATEETLSTLATESTVSTLLSEATFTNSQNDSDEVIIDISTDSVGLFKSSDFTEDRNVRELQNETGVTSGTHSGGGSLPSNAVPDGKAVSVKAQFGNAGAVYVNGDYPLLEGDSVELQVGNTDQISYTTDNGTEGVAFIVEG